MGISVARPQSGSFIHCFQVWIGIWKCWFFVEGGKAEYSEKNPRSKDENQQQTQPTYCVDPALETIKETMN